MLEHVHVLQTSYNEVPCTKSEIGKFADRHTGITADSTFQAFKKMSNFSEQKCNHVQSFIRERERDSD